MMRALDLKAFERTAGPTFASSRLWGIARPRIRRSAEEVRSWARASLDSICGPWTPEILSGRTSYGGPLAKLALKNSLRRALGRRTYVLRSVDYEQMELRAFAKQIGFGHQGGLSPKTYASKAFASMIPQGAFYAQAVSLAAWGDALGPRPLAMARPNDWRRDVIERAFEGGAFDEIPSEHFHRGPNDVGYQRAIADRIKNVTGRTVHRKSWKAAAIWLDHLFALRRLSAPASKATSPRLRWDDVRDFATARTES